MEESFLGPLPWATQMVASLPSSHVSVSRRNPFYRASQHLLQVGLNNEPGGFCGTGPAPLALVRLWPTVFKIVHFHKQHCDVKRCAPFRVLVAAEWLGYDASAQASFLNRFLQCGFFSRFPRIDNSLWEELAFLFQRSDQTKRDFVSVPAKRNDRSLSDSRWLR